MCTVGRIEWRSPQKSKKFSKPEFSSLKQNLIHFTYCISLAKGNHNHLLMFLNCKIWLHFLQNSLINAMLEELIWHLFWKKKKKKVKHCSAVILESPIPVEITKVNLKFWQYTSVGILLLLFLCLEVCVLVFVFVFLPCQGNCFCHCVFQEDCFLSLYL